MYSVDTIILGGMSFCWERKRPLGQGIERYGQRMLDWNEVGGGVRRSPLWTPRSWTRAPPVPPPSHASLRACTGGARVHERVGPTVDSYGPPPHSSQAYMGQRYRQR